MAHKIIIFGSSGQLARALKTHVQEQGFDAIFLSRADCDLSDSPKSIANTLLQMTKPDIVIIAAAYTQVDQAETDRDTAFAVNALAPEIIAQTCADLDIPLIYISTDYVFDGQANTPYKITNSTSPINVYGASKREGEKRILQTPCRAAILRTSWVFDGIGKNFLTTMLKLQETHSKLTIIDDQMGRPTYSGHLANAILVCAKHLIAKEPSSTGIFHVTGSGPTTNWANFAQTIFDKNNAKTGTKTTIIPIGTKDYPTLAKRPLYSVMDINHFERVFKHSLPKWHDGIDLAFAEREHK